MAKIQDIRSRTQRTNNTRKLSQIKHIVRHHSATDTGNFDTFWKHWNGTNGWGTGGYHEIILRDGTVQLCYDPNEITNGVSNYNTPCYHICLVGNGSFTAAQEKAWDERVAYNMDRLNIGVDHVRGHQEMPNARTSCPGINMNTVRNRIKGIVSKPGDSTWNKMTNAQKHADATKVIREEGLTVKKYQQNLISAGMSLPNYGADGVFGAESLKATESFQLQHDLSSPSGNFFGRPGPATIKKLEEVTKSKPTANLEVDGYWGKLTTAALQNALGTVADGEIWNQSNNPITRNIMSGVKFGSGGSPVIRELQEKVGSTVDGYLGVNTFRSLQRYLGTPADGELWKPSAAVRELQLRLNAGTF